MGMITGVNLTATRASRGCEGDEEVDSVYKHMDSKLLFIKCLFHEK